MNPEIRPYQQGSTVAFNDRSAEIRRDTDKVVVPKITLWDIDYAVYFHLTEKLKLFVISDGVKVNVPVMFTNGEKWSQIRQYGFIRDNNKKVITPLIILRRNDVANDDRISVLPGQSRGTGTTLRMIPYKTNGMQYDRIAGQYLTKESTEFYLVAIPTYVRVTYDVIVWTDTQEQMNSVTQTIIPTDQHKWVDFHTFRTTIQ